MAHILRVSVEGLVGRTDRINFDLNNDVNIFFGGNGCGKTSLLKILDSALFMDATLLESVPFKSAEVTMYSITYDREFTLTINKKENSFPIEAEFDPRKLASGTIRHRARKTLLSEDEPGEWTISPDVEFTSWDHSFLPTSRLYINDYQTGFWSSSGVNRNLSGRAVTEKELDSNFAEGVQNLWGGQFGSVVKNVNDIQQKGLREVFEEALIFDSSNLQSSKKEASSKGAYESMARFLNRTSSKTKTLKLLGAESGFTKKYKDNVLLRNIVNHIVNVESEIDNTMKPLNELERLVRNLFSKGKTVNFDGPQISVRTSDETEISLANLSSGEKHLIRILLEALRADANSLIIDEPEISMHIDWQRSLVANLRTLNPYCQLIMATHSPEIMADIEDSRIFKL